MHAIGDRAVRDALDAIAAARTANGANDNRHHIAHVQLVRPRDVPRFAQLGVTANIQAYWAQNEPQMTELTIPLLGPERARRQYPFADLHRAGATIAMGSDWPVTTADPLQQIEVATRRTDPANRYNPPFLPGQVLPVDLAIRAFTAGSAYVKHDAEAGSISVGKRADLTALDRNILNPQAGPPADAHITHTIAAGRLVYTEPA